MDTPTFPSKLELDNGTVIEVANNPKLKEFFDQCVTASATIEKNKLYATIQSKDNEITRISGELTKANKMVQDAATAIQKSEQQREAQRKMIEENVAQQQQQTPVDSAQIKSMIENALNGFAAQLPEMFQREIGSLKPVVDELRANHIQTYLATRLAELGDSVIPQLVKGNTKEEIENSIVVASQLRQQYAPVNAQQPTPVSTSQQVQTPIAPVVPKQTIVPVLPSMTTPQAASIPDLSNMSDTEFTANRDSIAEYIKSIANANDTVGQP